MTDPRRDESVEAAQGAEIDRQIVGSYTHRPQEDLLGAERTAPAMVEAEPWR
jgi:hypothetical protein